LFFKDVEKYKTIFFFKLFVYDLVSLML